MKTPLFTIITTTFNRRDFIPRAIQSVLNQTFNDYELLIIDNGSTDDTAFVVQAIKDQRIKYILNPAPTSSCDAPRNLGIKMAKGSLVSFLDDDDIWYPEKLEKVKTVFDDKHDIGAVCHYINKRVNGRITSVIKHSPWVGDIHEQLIYEGNCISPSAITIKKKILLDLNGFDLRDQIVPASDYEFWIRMAEKGTKFYFIDQILGEASITGNNCSLIDPHFETKVVNIIQEHMLKAEKKSLYRISSKGMYRLLNLYLVSARAFFWHGDFSNLLKYSAKSLMLILFKPSLLAGLVLKIFNGSSRIKD